MNTQACLQFRNGQLRNYLRPLYETKFGHSLWLKWIRLIRQNRLRSFVVVDLKIGPFKTEYAGKLNFYCNVVRHATDNPTIDLILGQDKKRVLAEYALRGMDKPIGISEYELTRALPEELKSALPTIEEIEAELSAGLQDEK